MEPDLRYCNPENSSNGIERKKGSMVDQFANKKGSWRGYRIANYLFGLKYLVMGELSFSLRTCYHFYNFHFSKQIKYIRNNACNRAKAHIHVFLHQSTIYKHENVIS